MPSFACFFYLTDILSEIYSDISCTSLGDNITFCIQFTGEVTSIVVEINMTGLYQTMIGRLRQLSELRLRQQAGTEKSQTPVERDILAQWVRKDTCFISSTVSVYCDSRGEKRL